MSILTKNIVLVLNRNWQAINTTTPANAFCQMATDVATGLDITGEDCMIPTRWEDWSKLPVRESDESIGTANSRIRVPTVIVCVNFAQVPFTRPKFSPQNVWARDEGVCQYTGEQLKVGEGNIDHVVPRSRGGATNWENCVLAAKRVNTRKADLTPDEAGLKLLRKPKAPKQVPVTVMLQNTHEIDDWNPFLVN
ncbi:MAG: HNH endonuclease [Verrucomicrobiota bacterium]